MVTYKKLKIYNIYLNYDGGKMKSTLLIVFLSLFFLELSAVIHQIGCYDPDGYVSIGRTTIVNDSIAYVCSSNGLRIMDISPPEYPQLIGISFLNCMPTDICIVGNIAYVCFYSSGLQVLDISNPTNPVNIGWYMFAGTPRRITVVNSRAYICTDLGFTILDISNPTAPQLVGTCAISHYGANDISVVGTIAYVATGFGGFKIYNLDTTQDPNLIGSYIFYQNDTFSVSVIGNFAYILDSYFMNLRILDVSDPTNPQSIGTFFTSDMPRSCKIVGNTAYIAARYSGLEIVNISNPEDPTLIAFFDPIYDVEYLAILDNIIYISASYFGLKTIDASDLSNQQIIGSLDTLGAAKSLTVSDSIAYVANGTNGLQLINISNPQNPIPIGSYDTPNSASSVTVSGNIAYVADGHSLQIIDVSNSGSPQFLSSFTPSLANSVYIENNIAYVAQMDGMQIIDVSNPQNPQLLSSCNTQGRYALDIKVSEGIAYVSDYNSGLEVFNVSNPQYPEYLSSYHGYDMNFALSGHFAYVSDSYSQVEVIDFSNPSVPIVIRTLQAHLYERNNKVYVKDNLLFVVDGYWDEIRIYDISNESNPIPIQRYSWNMRTMDLCLLDGRLYTLELTYGMYILDFNSIVPVIDPVIIPSNKLMLSSYPNPFNPSTTISFDLTSAGFMKLDVYNIKGQHIKSLVKDHLEQGKHQVSWNGTDDQGHAVASGIYFAKLDTAGKTTTKKLVMVK